MAVDASGNLFITDDGNSRVRSVSPSGIITTVAGNGAAGNGFLGYSSGDAGPATSVALSNPQAVAVDPAGNVYI